jgi:hypothetical protein
VLRLKDLWGRSVGEKVTVRDGKILVEFEGLLGGAPIEGRHRRSVPEQHNHYSISVLLVKDNL